MRQPYSAQFYEQQSDGSTNSARAIVPLVVELVSPRSVVDVGCGVGAWAAAFTEQGIDDVIGIDGDYVDREALLIDRERYVAADLSVGVACGRRFDLAVSLEVGEHLPAAAAARFVRDLTTLAPVILFSAAIPHQGGSAHINERWQSEWAALFAAEGFVVVDPIRPRVWSDPRVEFWYAQNALVYVRPERLRQLPLLAAAGSQWSLDLIHPSLYLLQNARAGSSGHGSASAARIRGAVGRRMRRAQTRVRRSGA